MKTIGKITRTHGFEGAVVIRSESRNIREPEQGEPVFIVIDGIPVPFFTREAYSPSPGTLVISFDDYSSDKEVMNFKGCVVKSEESTDEDEGLSELKDYTVIDEASGFEGIILSLITGPGQTLAVVKGKEGEVLIPLHPDLIMRVDRRRRSLFMSLPTGLLGINE